MNDQNKQIETDKKTGELKTIVGRGTLIEGRVSIQSSGRIDGVIRGELLATDTVVVGEEGSVIGDIIGETIIIGGKVIGNVYATKRVVLETKSSLKGDLISPKVTIAEGTYFNGSCKMVRSKEIVVDKKSHEMKVIDLSPEEILTSK
jgi:cytoskeletal protein CcmA (bactofilin family)